MAINKVTQSVVTYSDGRIGLQIMINGQLYASLVSDIVPKTQEEIDVFTSNVANATTNGYLPQNEQPLEENAEKKANVTRAINISKNILAKVFDLPERAAEYGSSVEEKTTSILSWVEEKDHVTNKQLESLENMNNGLDKWLCNN